MSGYDDRISNRWKPKKQTDLSMLTLPGTVQKDRICLASQRKCK